MRLTLRTMTETSTECQGFINCSFLYLEETVEFIYYTYLEDVYFSWLAWILWPIVITFALPAVICLLVYASALFLQLFKLRHHIRNAYNQPHLWDRARHMIAVFWHAQGRLWHGYEIDGFEKLPHSGPALLVYYHGAIPIDVYYLLSCLLLKTDRQLRLVGDRFLFSIPGMRLMMEVFHVMPGTVSSCVDLMKQGHLLAIAPGGVREAYFSDEHYKLLWGKRIGFAKIAIEAKVPVIPIFTQNCRESFRSLGWGRPFFRWLYEKTRLPLVPLYGGFPVKLKSIIGDPVCYDPSLSPEQLSAKVHAAVEDLIKKNQRIPGNILRALLDRIPWLSPSHSCESS